MTLNRDDLKQFYEQLYETDYMIEDGFASWSQVGVELSRVKDVLREVSGSVRCILDYGCGQGRWADVLCEVFPKACICGIDISEKAIELAKQLHPQHKFVAFEGERAPFAEASFDLLFSYHVLEHVYDLNAVVRDMIRLVKPGGHLCLIFPCGNKGSLEEKTMRLIEGGKIFTEAGEPVFFFEQSAGHLRRMESWQIVELFSVHGGTRLCAQYYANQFFGALDYITRSTDGGYIRKFFDVARATDPQARLLLQLYRSLFLTLRRLVRLGQAKDSGLLGVLGRWSTSEVEALALREWQKRRADLSGSAQFLLFEKL